MFSGCGLDEKIYEIVGSVKIPEEKTKNIVVEIPEQVSEIEETETEEEKQALYEEMLINFGGIINYEGKLKSRYTKTGVISGRRDAFKKAIVTLAKGETIDFFSNI